MKVLLLISLLLVPSTNCLSKEKQQELDYELEFQKEGDDLKIKVAALTALCLMALLWARGSGDDAKAFDEMSRNISSK